MNNISQRDKDFIKYAQTVVNDDLLPWFVIEEMDFEGENENSLVLAHHTKGGAEVGVVLYTNHSDSFEKQFTDYVDGFNVNEEIDLFRQDIDRYKKDDRNFTIRGSAEDFEDFKEWLDDTKFSIMSREINSTMKAKEFSEGYGWNVELDDSYPQAFATIEKECGEMEVMSEEEFVDAVRELWVSSKENNVDLSDYIESWDDQENHNKNKKHNKNIEMDM